MKRILKRSVFIALAAALVAACLFVACSRKEEAAAAAPAAEKVIRFSWWGDDPRHTATIKVMTRYDELNPSLNLKMEGEYSGWQGYLEKMVVQLSAGTAPDIMQIDYAFLEPFWQQMDNFVDFKKDTVIDKSGFGQAMLDGITASTGELIGLPTGLNFNLQYANKLAADKYGIDLTQHFSWDRVLSEGPKVNQQDPEAYLLMAASNDGITRYIFEPHLVNQSGLKMVQDDYTLGFNREQVLNTYRYIKALWDQKVLQPYDEVVELTADYENPKWLSDQIVMTPGWAAQFVPELTSKGDNLVCVPPMGDSEAVNTGIVLRPSNMLSANAKSPYVNEVLGFLNYFFNDVESIDTLEMVRAIPSTTQALDRLAETGVLHAGYKAVADFCVAHKGGAGQNVITTNREIDTITNDVMAQLYYGDLTPETAADMFVQRMTAKVAELKAIAQR